MGYGIVERHLEMAQPTKKSILLKMANQLFEVDDENLSLEVEHSDDDDDNDGEEHDFGLLEPMDQVIHPCDTF